MRSFWLVAAVVPRIHGIVNVILAEMVLTEEISPQKSASRVKNGGIGVGGNPIKVQTPVREPSLLGSPSSEIQTPMSKRAKPVEVRTNVALNVTVSPTDVHPSSETTMLLTLEIVTSFLVHTRLLLSSC